jgi:hypothetical protein
MSLSLDDLDSQEMRRLASLVAQELRVSRPLRTAQAGRGATLQLDVAALKQQLNRPKPVMLLAKITGNGQSAGRFTAKQVHPDGSDVTDGVTWDSGQSGARVFDDLRMVNGYGPPFEAEPVVAHQTGASGTKDTWWFTGGGPFPAIITGASSDGTNKWVYDWEEGELSGGGLISKSGGRTGSGNAHNLAEIGHGSSAAWGVDPTGSSYDATNLSPQAVGSTQSGSYNVGVWMYETIDREFYFALMGSHDGTCEESS